MHWTEDPQFDHLVRNAAQAHPRAVGVNSLTGGTGPLTWKQLDKAIEVSNDSFTWQLPTLVTPGSEILTLGSVQELKDDEAASDTE